MTCWDEEEEAAGYCDDDDDDAPPWPEAKAAAESVCNPLAAAEGRWYLCLFSGGRTRRRAWILRKWETWSRRGTPRSKWVWSSKSPRSRKSILMSRFEEHRGENQGASAIGDQIKKQKAAD